ncbi:uncharacterized protein LOC130049361 [Ostrea edulis]|uniref:uncharacterized protein LOC130049361 n=1 Tax=Ostrea edulis TaxID=37623 RepID=UPI0024AEE395|nr:uncharacterized protein LOC130049361 [Ostrea edulis]
MSEESESEENSEDLKSEDSSEESDPDDEDTAESGTSEENGVEQNASVSTIQSVPKLSGFNVDQNLTSSFDEGLDHQQVTVQIWYETSVGQGDEGFIANCRLFCKEKHVIDLHTKHHGVAIYREKFKCVPLRATCVRHPDRKYRMFCYQCNYSVCKSCTDHRTHALVDLTTIYQTKRKQHREIIDNIRSETLYNCRVLLAGIQTNIQTCSPQICHHHSQMFTKAEGLKDLIDTAVCDVKKRYRGLLIDRIQQQKRNMNRHLTHIQNYEDRYEQSANRAVQFLLFIKTSRVPQIKDTPNLPQHMVLSVSEGFNLEDVSQFLRQIPQMHMTTRKRQVGIDECVKLMSTPVLHTSVCVTGVSRVLHISRVMPDGVWVRDFSKLILTDTTGDTIHRVTNIGTWYG